MKAARTMAISDELLHNLGGSGVVVITSAGKVTLCSEQARIWLAEYFDAVFLARGVKLDR